MSIIIIISLAVITSLLFRAIYKHKLREAFGLLWDRQFNAYCPRCKETCFYCHNFELNEGTFYCNSCMKRFTPKDNDGIRLSYGELVYLLVIIP